MSAFPSKPQGRCPGKYFTAKTTHRSTTKNLTVFHFTRHLTRLHVNNSLLVLCGIDALELKVATDLLF
jgi:hypothetical protein